MSLFKRQLARNGQSIDILTRKLLTGLDDNETEVFTVVLTAPALPCTPRGRSVIDGVSIETDITHEFHIEYPDSVTINSENWVLFKGRNFRVLDFKNCCEKDARFVLFCTDRGDEIREANHA